MRCRWKDGLAGMSGGTGIPRAAPVVLVVDDDPQFRLMVRLVLASLDAYAAVRVQEARDGQAAVELLRAATTGYLVVLDDWMPRMTGEEVLREIARDPALQRHAYLFVSATADMLASETCALAQALEVPILGKPFLLEAFAAQLDRLWARLQAVP